MAKNRKKGKPSDTTAEVKLWQDRIERAKEIRTKVMAEAMIYVEMYKGNQWEDTDYNASIAYQPVTNLIFPHIKSQLPYLYFQHPKWEIRPTKRARMANRGIDMIKNAETSQMLLNYYIHENLGAKFKRQMRLTVLDAFFSYGVLKTGYVGDFEVNPNHGKFSVIGEDGGGNPIYDVDAEGNAKIDEEEYLLVDEKFYIDRVSPAAMLFDPEAGDSFEDGRFIIQEMVKSLNDVKENKAYKNTDELVASFELEPRMGVKSEKHAIEDTTRLDSFQRITLYEIYDLDNDKIKTIAEGGTEFLRNDPVPEGIKKHPFSFLVFNDVPDEPYPMSDIRPLVSPQREYNMGRSMIMTHAKRFNRKYGAIKSKFDEDEWDILENGSDGAIFGVPDLPLSESIEALENPPMDGSVYANFDQTKTDFREVGGATENERGLVERRKTAFEASQISQASNTRKEDRRSLVEDFAADAGAKLLLSLQENLTFPELVRLVGEGEATEYRDIGREDIRGDMLVGVELGSASPKIPQYERQDLMALMQAIPMFPQDLVQTVVNLKGILKKVAKSFDTLDEEDVLNSPEEIQRQEEIIKKMRQFEGLMKGGALKMDNQKKGQQQ